MLSNPFTVPNLLPMPNYSTRLSGVLDAKQLLIAEAVQARALVQLEAEGALVGTDPEAAKAKLGAIVVGLMLKQVDSREDLTSAAVAAFTAK